MADAFYHFRIPRKSDPGLRKLFLNLNQKHFGNKLPACTVVAWRRWLPDGVTGYYFGYDCVIVLSREMNRDREDTLRTLVHEMTHEYLRHRTLKDLHGYTFRREMHRLAIERAYESYTYESYIADANGKRIGRVYKGGSYE